MLLAQSQSRCKNLLSVPQRGQIQTTRRVVRLGQPVPPTFHGRAKLQIVASGDVPAVLGSVEAPRVTPTAPSTLYTGKKAVVVGAGPAGSTAAMYLAREGFNVDVYERRPEPKADMVDNGRAYIIILVPRGKAALEELGIEMPKDPHYQTQGTVRHPAKGKVSISKEEGNVTWSRSSLAQFLIDQATSRYPNQIRFFFSKEVQSVDFDSNKVVFESLAPATLVGDGPGSLPSVDDDNSTAKASYDLLVGADGAASKVRDALQKHIPGFTVDVSDSGREYKVYLNLTGDIEPPEFAGKPGATLHLWTATDDPFMSFTAHRNPDATYSGTFSMRSGAHANVISAQAYETLLRTKFNGVPDAWIPLIAKQVAQSVASPAGKRIRCSQLAGPGVVVLGDAAHAVTPVFGQGANSSLESARVLGQALKDAAGDVAALPAKFDDMRRPDAHGLYEIDRKAFSFFSRKGPFDPDFLQLLSHVLLGTILSKIVPFLYGSKPLLMQLGSAPYSDIVTAVRRDSLAAAALFSMLIVFCIAKVFHVL